MFRFPWSNFHELNLDWILEVVKEAKEIFINGEGDIQHAVDTAEQALEVAEEAAAAVIADGAVTIPKLNNEVLKTTAYVIVGNRADEPVPAGAYVYLRKSEVAGLADGIYIAAASIPAGAIVTPAEFQQPSELHDAGALNVLKNTLTQLDSDLDAEVATRQTYVRPNLLDNWYFIYGKAIDTSNQYVPNGTFPINQRGNQVYTNADYGIDRWFNNGNNTMAVNASGNGLYVESFVRQYVEHPEQLFGKTVTVSALISPNIFISATGAIASDGVSVVASFETKNVYIYAHQGQSVSVCITDSSNASLVVQAVKLELGSGQTLAHWDGTKWVLNEIPNYGEELAKCQRYYYKESSTSALLLPLGCVMAHSVQDAFASITTPVPMNTISSILGSNIELEGITSGGYASVGVNVNYWALSGNNIGVYFRDEGSRLVAGNSYSVFIRPTGSLEINADL